MKRMLFILSLTFFLVNCGKPEESKENIDAYGEWQGCNQIFIFVLSMAEYSATRTLTFI